MTQEEYERTRRYTVPGVYVTNPETGGPTEYGGGAVPRIGRVTPGLEGTFASEMEQTRMEAPFRPQEETVGEWQAEAAMRQADERVKREQAARRQGPTDEFGTAMDAAYFQDLQRARATPAPSTPSPSGAQRGQTITTQQVQAEAMQRQIEAQEAASRAVEANRRANLAVYSPKSRSGAMARLQAFKNNPSLSDAELDSIERVAEMRNGQRKGEVTVEDLRAMQDADAAMTKGPMVEVGGRRQAITGARRDTGKQAARFRDWRDATMKDVGRAVEDASREIGVEVQKKNPRTEEEYDKIVEDAAKKNPLAAGMIREKAWQQLPPGIEQARKIAGELEVFAGKEAIELEAFAGKEAIKDRDGAGVTEFGVFRQRGLKVPEGRASLNKYESDLRSRQYSPEAIASEINGIRSGGDPEAAKRWDDWRNAEKTSKDEGSSQRAAAEAAQRVAEGRADPSNKNDMAILGKHGVTQTDADLWEFDPDSMPEGYPQVATLGDKSAVIGEMAASTAALVASGRDPAAAAEAVMEQFRSAGKIKGVGDDGKLDENTKRYLAREAVRAAKTNAETNIRAAIEKEREANEKLLAPVIERVKGLQATDSAGFATIAEGIYADAPMVKNPETKEQVRDLFAAAANRVVEELLPGAMTDAEMRYIRDAKAAFLLGERNPLYAPIIDRMTNVHTALKNVDGRDAGEKHRVEELKKAKQDQWMARRPFGSNAAPPPIGHFKDSDGKDVLYVDYPRTDPEQKSMPEMIADKKSLKANEDGRARDLDDVRDVGGVWQLDPTKKRAYFTYADPTILAKIPESNETQELRDSLRKGYGRLAGDKVFKAAYDDENPVTVLIAGGMTPEQGERAGAAVSQFINDFKTAYASVQTRIGGKSATRAATVEEIVKELGMSSSKSPMSDVLTKVLTEGMKGPLGADIKRCMTGDATMQALGVRLAIASAVSNDKERIKTEAVSYARTAARAMIRMGLDSQADAARVLQVAEKSFERFESATNDARDRLESLGYDPGIVTEMMNAGVARYNAKKIGTSMPTIPDVMEAAINSAMKRISLVSREAVLADIRKMKLTATDGFEQDEGWGLKMLQRANPREVLELGPMKHVEDILSERTRGKVGLRFFPSGYTASSWMDPRNHAGMRDKMIQQLREGSPRATPEQINATWDKAMQEARQRAADEAVRLHRAKQADKLREQGGDYDVDQYVLGGK